MNGCLLCLEITQDLVESIKKDSIKWQELNIENLIVKHFWPMVNKKKQQSKLLHTYKNLFF